MKYEAILFDMDGVLIDSEELMCRSGIRALADFGVQAVPEDFVPFVGRGERKYIGGVAEKYGVPYDPEMKERSYDYYGEKVEEEAFVPKEIPSLLYTLKGLGLKLAVCTSADWNKVKHNLRAIGVSKDFFDALVTGDCISHLKPDPEIYLTGAKLANVDPEKCIVVEDAPSGINAAHAGGMLAVGIDTSFPAEKLIRDSHPDILIHTLSELLRIVADPPFPWLYRRTALITGASGGIGKALCKKIGSYGMNVVLTGRNSQRLEETANEVTRAGGIPLIFTGELSDETFPEKAIAAAVERFGGLDVLINCAGVAHHDRFEEVTPELYDKVMTTNVKAPFFLCQKALPALRASSCATIINICSVTAHKGYPEQSVYSASKHALLGLSKSLAAEVYKENIRVHTISPGGVFTDMIALARPDLTSDGMTLPEDIADLAGFLLEHRMTNAVVDEIMVHRTAKEPFL